MRDILLLIGRLLFVPMFLAAGINKLLAWPGVVGAVSSKGIPFATVAGAGTVAVEIIAPVLIGIGLYTRYSAAILAAFVVLATYFFHDLAPAALLGEKNILIIGGLLVLAAVGPGRFAVNPRT